MFCARCGTSNDDSAKFCQKCGTGLAAPPAPAAPAADTRMRGVGAPETAAGKRYAVGRNPTIATILSLLIVGVGQFYNGDVKKGAIMLVVAIVGSLLTMGIAWLACAVWSAVDAYRVASGKAPLW